jgi:signal peptidase I
LPRALSPQRLSANALLDALNLLYDYDEYLAALKERNGGPPSEIRMEWDNSEKNVSGEEFVQHEDADDSTRHGMLAQGVYEWLTSLVCVLVPLVLIFTTVARIMGVEGISMEPTLYDKDYVFVTSEIFARPQQGDIVMLRKESFMQIPLVKRVIATEGQTVDIDFEAGIVYVDGKALEEPYVKEPTHSMYDVLFPVTVPEHCIFVMGDNRNNSTDSRYAAIGMVDRRLLLGEVRFILFPFHRIGGVT